MKFSIRYALLIFFVALKCTYGFAQQPEPQHMFNELERAFAAGTQGDLIAYYKKQKYDFFPALPIIIKQNKLVMLKELKNLNAVKFADLSIEQKYTLLRSAVETNNLQALKMLADYNVKLSDISIDQIGVLINIALSLNMIEILQYILSLGLPLDQLRGSDRLFLLAKSRKELIKPLMDAGITFTNVTPDEAVGLMVTLIAQNRLDFLQFAVNSGLNVSDLKTFAWTSVPGKYDRKFPVFYNIREWGDHAVHITSPNFTVIHLAIFYAHTEILSYLLTLPSAKKIVNMSATCIVDWHSVGEHSDMLDWQLDSSVSITLNPFQFALFLREKNYHASTIQAFPTQGQYDKVIKVLEEYEYQKFKNLLPAGAPITKQISYKTDTGIRSNDVNLLHIAIMEGNVAGVQAVLAKANEQERKQLLQAKADINFGDVPGGEPMTPKRLAERLKKLVAPTKLTWGMAAYGKKLRNAGLNEEVFDEIITILNEAENKIKGV